MPRLSWTVYLEGHEPSFKAMGNLDADLAAHLLRLRAAHGEDTAVFLLSDHGNHHASPSPGPSSNPSPGPSPNPNPSPSPSPSPSPNPKPRQYSLLLLLLLLLLPLLLLLLRLLPLLLLQLLTGRPPTPPAATMPLAVVVTTRAAGEP